MSSKKRKKSSLPIIDAIAKVAKLPELAKPLVYKKMKVGQKITLMGKFAQTLIEKFGVSGVFGSIPIDAK